MSAYICECMCALVPTLNDEYGWHGNAVLNAVSASLRYASISVGLFCHSTGLFCHMGRSLLTLTHTSGMCVCLRSLLSVCPGLF